MSNPQDAARLLVDDLRRQVIQAELEYQQAEAAWKAADEEIGAAAVHLEHLKRAGRAVCQVYGIKFPGEEAVS